MDFIDQDNLLTIGKNMDLEQMQDELVAEFNPYKSLH